MCLIAAWKLTDINLPQLIIDILIAAAPTWGWFRNQFGAVSFNQWRTD